MKTNLSIPIVDLQPLWDGSYNGVKSVADSLSKNFREVGFAYIINHQIPKNLIDDIFQMAADFHALPLSVKKKILQNRAFRGYLPVNDSQINLSSQGSAKQPNLLWRILNAALVKKL
ncbi:MAG: 2-oxoglutarate and iron-dependent oxygenase domain-containing protein [Pseudomonadota bacterium]